MEEKSLRALHPTEISIQNIKKLNIKKIKTILNKWGTGLNREFSKDETPLTEKEFLNIQCAQKSGKFKLKVH